MVIKGAMMVLVGNMIEALGPDAAYYYEDMAAPLRQ